VGTAGNLQLIASQEAGEGAEVDPANLDKALDLFLLVRGAGQGLAALEK
jgi:hypothetical protein